MDEQLKEVENIIRQNPGLDPAQIYRKSTLFESQLELCRVLHVLSGQATVVKDTEGVYHHIDQLNARLTADPRVQAGPMTAAQRRAHEASQMLRSPRPDVNKLVEQTQAQIAAKVEKKIEQAQQESSSLSTPTPAPKAETKDVNTPPKELPHSHEREGALRRSYNMASVALACYRFRDRSLSRDTILLLTEMPRATFSTTCNKLEAEGYIKKLDGGKIYKWTGKYRYPFSHSYADDYQRFLPGLDAYLKSLEPLPSKRAAPAKTEPEQPASQPEQPAPQPAPSNTSGFPVTFERCEVPKMVGTPAPGATTAAQLMDMRIAGIQEQIKFLQAQLDQLVEIRKLM